MKLLHSNYYHLLLAMPILLVSFLHPRHCYCEAFLTGPPGGFISNRGVSNNNHGGMIPPPRSHNHRHHDGGGDDFDGNRLLLASAARNDDKFQNETSTDSSDDDVLLGISRGGSTKQKQDPNRVLKGTKATFETTTSYWSNAFGKAGQAITAPFRIVKEQVSSRFQSQEAKREQELLEKLETMKVQSVVMVPNNTVVPPEVVQLAARRSGLIGNPLRNDRLQEFAASLKRWYQMRGYVLHSVEGATLNADSATAEIQVQEPHVARHPVEITFCKEMVVDPETGNILTFRQYKERHMKRKTFGHKAITKADTNTTFVQTTGKTRPGRIAQALGLQPGKPFQWDSSRWRTVANSGIFARILRASPQRLRDGSVQLQILATEAPARHLEYGVSKSLYTGSWEGEIDFQHGNLLGGGESLALMVRRGTKDPEPSVTLRFSDDRFGMPGGYDIEAFSDFIGGDSNENDKSMGSDESKTTTTIAEADKQNTNDPNKLLDRRGIKFTFRNPIGTNVIQHSSASTSLERTATQSGIREAIGSGSLAIGPFRKQLPLDARSSFHGRLTTGLRIPEESIVAASTPEKSGESGLRGGSSSSSYQGLTLLPFTSFRLTTTQVLPLLTSSSSSSSSDEPKKQPSLALRHSVSGSTRNLPLHEQNAMGFSSMIRGGAPKGSISTFVTGSTELRIPLQLGVLGNSAAMQNILQDASVVLFGDWVSTRKNNGAQFSFEKSIGFGFRKITQGIPLKLDFSYADSGKIKSSFGLGKDFDV